MDGNWTMVGDVRGKPVTYTLEARPALLGAFTERRMQDAKAGEWRFVLESQQANGSWKHFAQYKVARRAPG